MQHSVIINVFEVKYNKWPEIDGYRQIWKQTIQLLDPIYIRGNLSVQQNLREKKGSLYPF